MFAAAGEEEGMGKRRDEQRQRICRIPAEPGGKEKSISLVVFSADHNLDYRPDFHLICSFVPFLLLQLFFSPVGFQPFSSRNSALYDV